MSKSTTRAEGRFKQLCCLGLGGEAVIPSLLAELHGLVRSYATTFHFADERGQPSNVYSDHPGFIDLLPLYSEVFFERRDREVKGLAYSEASPWQFGVHDAESALGPDYDELQRRSGLFDLIGRPLGTGTKFLRLFVRDGRRKRTLGCVKLNASPEWDDWTGAERRRLASLETFFAYALTARAEDTDVLADSGRAGVIIADPAGKPIHLSPEGRRLLFLATHPNIAPDTTVSRVPVLPPAVVRICQNLSRASSADPTTSAPGFHHRNPWGGFRFRAEWLDGNDPTTGRVAITITHEEPLPIRLTNAVAVLPLTRRQAEVCVLMALGQSRGQIAAQLGISQHTAREHGRWVYLKLDAHSRGELLSKLLSVSVN